MIVYFSGTNEILITIFFISCYLSFFFNPLISINNQQTQWNRVLLVMLTVPQLIKKFPKFCATWRFITVFTWTSHLSLSWVRSVQSMSPCPISWRSILITSSHLYQGLLSGVFSLVFLLVTYMHILFSQYVPVELMARKIYCLALQAFNGFLE